MRVGVDGEAGVAATAVVMDGVIGVSHGVLFRREGQIRSNRRALPSRIAWRSPAATSGLSTTT